MSRSTCTRGEVLGLVGESGSGKTTVALAMLGHVRRGLRFAGGAVRLDGLDVLRSAGSRPAEAPRRDRSPTCHRTRPRR